MAGSPPERPVDRNIRRVVAALMERDNVSALTMSGWLTDAGLHVSQDQVYLKQRPTPDKNGKPVVRWKPPELAVLAEHFGEDPGIFFHAPELVAAQAGIAKAARIVAGRDHGPRKRGPVPNNWYYPGESGIVPDSTVSAPLAPTAGSAA